MAENSLIKDYRKAAARCADAAKHQRECFNIRDRIYNDIKREFKRERGLTIIANIDREFGI